MPLNISAADEAIRSQRFCSQVTMSRIERDLRQQQNFENKKAELEKNKRKLKKLISVFNNEFSEDSYILSFFQAEFVKWSNVKYRRNYDFAVIQMKNCFSSTFPSFSVRFESVLVRVEEELDKEDKETKKLEEREAFKKKYMEMRENVQKG